MKTRSKLYVFALISAGIALSGSLQGNDAGSATYQLLVNGGTGTGEYAPGTMVSVSASAAPAGASFVRWTGDVEILANRFLSTTTATVPLQTVAITATYVHTGVVAATMKAPLDHLGLIVATLIRDKATSDGRLSYLSQRLTQP
jgi:Divergent InlB B-repeat domain